MTSKTDGCDPCGYPECGCWKSPTPDKSDLIETSAKYKEHPMNDLVTALRGACNDPPEPDDYLDQILIAGADEIERLENENIAIIVELERSRELRAKIDVQSMKAMDQLRAQIRSLGAEPLL